MNIGYIRVIQKLKTNGITQDEFMNYDYNEKPILIDHSEFVDHRGSFYETYNKNILLTKYNIDKNFIVDNHSISHKNVIRGLHYQWEPKVDKLVRVSNGSILDVVVDIRLNSNKFGFVYKFLLSSISNKQLLIPSGFAHGFVAFEDNTHVQYKFTAIYNPKNSGTIYPFDTTLDIDWKIKESAICSKKDLNAESFSDYSKNPKFL